MMADRPSRIVDAHVHLWDPARTDWYPYLSGPHQQIPGGDAARMNRRFDVESYRAESAAWNVERIVNVAAATGRHSVDETIELDRRAGDEGGPDAVVGGLPPTETVGEAIELIDRQMTASRFRGVRPMGGLDRPLPAPEVLRALQERRLVFELMAHPDRLQEAAQGLGGFGELVIVVEHTGWPRTDTDDERSLWRTGMKALAELGSNVVCKLSGLAMPLGSMNVGAIRGWIEYAIEIFGIDRAMFASNFPVDSIHGSFDDLYGIYDEITTGLDIQSRLKLFAANAERIYRL